jgi:asparagine synthase (glutamine-hydrolysing)
MSYGIRHYNWINIFRDNEKDDLFSNDYKRELNSKVSYGYLKQFIERCASDDTVDKVMYTDINTNLLDDLIVKMDIATMANSLEPRSPFLDHRFMEFAASMPSNMKVRGTKLKYIFKKAFKHVLPRQILSRGKMGFGIPVHDWFRKELKDYSQDILMSEKCINRGYFKKEGVKNMLDEHIAGKVNHGARIWSLLHLELWHRIFVDGERLI